MKLSCSLCDFEFSSIILDKELALKELINKHAKHLNSEHKKELTKIARKVTEITARLPWYIQMTDYCDWDSDEEEYIDGEYQDCLDLMTEQLGLEIAEDEDQNEEEILDESKAKLPTKSITDESDISIILNGQKS